MYSLPFAADDVRTVHQTYGRSVLNSDRIHEMWKSRWTYYRVLKLWSDLAIRQLVQARRLLLKEQTAPRSATTLQSLFIWNDGRTDRQLCSQEHQSRFLHGFPNLCLTVTRSRSTETVVRADLMKPFIIWNFRLDANFKHTTSEQTFRS